MQTYGGTHIHYKRWQFLGQKFSSQKCNFHPKIFLETMRPPQEALETNFFFPIQERNVTDPFEGVWMKCFWGTKRFRPKILFRRVGNLIWTKQICLLLFERIKCSNRFLLFEHKESNRTSLKNVRMKNCVWTFTSTNIVWMIYFPFEWWWICSNIIVCVRMVTHAKCSNLLVIHSNQWWFHFHLNDGGKCVQMVIFNDYHSNWWFPVWTVINDTGWTKRAYFP